ncbi:MAG: DNA-directed RNA polymerase subunit omega [Bdellovibrionales bacterium]|nr:DNA-directed RNA polymerase subunit omega [Bdellovibrionales bacterium]
MARVTVEDCLTKVSNRFALVLLVTKRVKQFLKGDKCLVGEKNNNVVNALREVAADKISFDCGSQMPEEQLEQDLRVEREIPKHLSAD